MPISARAETRQCVSMMWKRMALWRSFLTHLECTGCGVRHDAEQLQTVCSACGKVLFARYDLDALRRAVAPDEFAARRWDMWRYAELLPIRNSSNALRMPTIPVPPPVG